MEDKKIIVEDGKVEDFSNCLYHGHCASCGERLTWEAMFDADGTSYMVECCNKQYRMHPHSVTTEVFSNP